MGRGGTGVVITFTAFGLVFKQAKSVASPGAGCDKLVHSASVLVHRRLFFTYIWCGMWLFETTDSAGHTLSPSERTDSVAVIGPGKFTTHGMGITVLFRPQRGVTERYLISTRKS